MLCGFCKERQSVFLKLEDPLLFLRKQRNWQKTADPMGRLIVSMPMPRSSIAMPEVKQPEIKILSNITCEVVVLFFLPTHERGPEVKAVSRSC